jgi:hypothetical protein
VGRYSTNSSTRHHIQKLGHDCYRLAWTQDRYYKDSRLRHPTRYTRDTDEKGARRFAKRWAIQMPEERAEVEGGRRGG